MGKKSKLSSEKVAVRARKKGGRAAVSGDNVFELKFNRQKQDVIGKASKKKREQSASASGRPTASRKRALELREAKLLPALKRLGKSNKFVDRRLAENDANLTADEKAARRLAAELKGRFFKNKRNKYLLEESVGDEELLTHYGQSLAEIEKHDRPVDIIDDDDYDEEGANFELPAGRRDVIQDLIAKSKMMRHEKQTQKDEQAELTDKLDEQYRGLLESDVIAALSKTPRTKDQQSEMRKTNKAKDSYDVAYRTLQFGGSRRAAASDPTVTAAKAAKEERDRLLRLEKERLARMKAAPSPFLEETVLPSKEQKFAVLYDEKGRLIDEDKLGAVVVRGRPLDSDRNTCEENSGEGVGNRLEVEENMEDDGSTASDLTGTEEATNEDTDEKKPPVAEKIAADVAFVFDMPANYDGLAAMLRGRTAREHLTILDRLIKCHHPSLKAGNKEKLRGLFMLLLRYFNEVSCRTPPDVATLDSLTRILFDLCQSSPNSAAEHVLLAVKRYADKLQKRGLQFPRKLGFYAFCQLVAALFPTSDMRHPIVTPTLILMTSVLSWAKKGSVADLTRGLLLSAQILEYLKQSGRYCPELVGFIDGVLSMAVGSDAEDDQRFISSTFSRRKLLLVDSCSVDVKTLSLKQVFAGRVEANRADMKVACLNCCVTLVEYLVAMWSSVEHFSAVFAPILSRLRRLPVEVLPADLRSSVNTLVADILCRISAETFKPLQVKVREKVVGQFEYLEPNFEANFNPEKVKLKKKRSAKEQNTELQKKYRRELRGTVRELRKDNRFIANQQLKVGAAKDQQRRKKTAALMKSLRGQENDYKQITAPNKKKRKK